MPGLEIGSRTGPSASHPADLLGNAVVGQHLAGLEGQGVLYIGRPFSTSAKSNIFSL